MLSINSSLVLLAGITDSSTPEIALHVWDLQYSVLLTSHAIPIPSTLTQSKEVSISLNLVATTTSQALLVLSSNNANPERKSQGSPSRSSVLIVPYSVPITSTISNAMGRASAAAKWLTSSSSSAAAGQPSQDAPYAKLLATMRTAMDQNKPQAANSAFFDWEKREMEKAQKAQASEAGASAKAKSVCALTEESQTP